MRCWANAEGDSYNSSMTFPCFPNGHVLSISSAPQREARGSRWEPWAGAGSLGVCTGNLEMTGSICSSCCCKWTSASPWTEDAASNRICHQWLYGVGETITIPILLIGRPRPSIAKWLTQDLNWVRSKARLETQERLTPGLFVFSTLSNKLKNPGVIGRPSQPEETLHA